MMAHVSILGLGHLHLVVIRQLVFWTTQVRLQMTFRSRWLVGVILALVVVMMRGLVVMTQSLAVVVMMSLVCMVPCTVCCPSGVKKFVELAVLLFHLLLVYVCLLYGSF